MSDTTTAIDEPTGTPPKDEIAAAIEALGPELLDELNDDYSDAILLVAQALGGRPEATEARLHSIDSGGVALLIDGPEGAKEARVAFANRLTDLGQVATELFALVARLAEQSGTPGTTSVERTMAEMSAIRTFLTEVVAVEDVHPHLRRITFGGGDLATFTPGWARHLPLRAAPSRRPDRAHDRPGLHLGGLRGDARGRAAARRVLHRAALER